MTHYAMVINVDTCVGCNACMAACSQANQTPVWDSSKFRTYVHDEEFQKDGRWVRQFFPRLCNQCDNPPCVTVCPTGATWKEPSGPVRVNPDVCMGCEACAMACPYDARYPIDREDVEQAKAYYGEEFLKRTHPAVDKCDFCWDRLQQGLEPACVETCVAHSRIFGDLDKPDDLVTKIVASGKAKTLLPELGTGPNVYYVDKLPEGLANE
jgi:sulfur reductase FeS subunit